MLTQEQQNTIEGMIDQHGIADVMLAIAQICYEKADHLETNWQDKHTAAHWLAQGRRIERTGDSL